MKKFKEDKQESADLADVKEIVADLEKLPQSVRDYALGIVKGAVMVVESQEEKKGA